MAPGSEFLLASSSPRRKQMLEWMGYRFSISAADVDETPLIDETPLDYVARVAQLKAHSLNGNRRGVVLAADTIVVDGARILGKPVDAPDAVRILKQLRNRIHRVFSALTLHNSGASRQTSDICISNVPMRDYSDEEIEQYVRSGDPLDKAGAYAIQNREFHPVIQFTDCYANVMGLPLCHTWSALCKEGIVAPLLPHQVCRDFLEYDCPVWRKYINGAERC